MQGDSGKRIVCAAESYGGRIGIVYPQAYVVAIGKHIGDVRPIDAIMKVVTRPSPLNRSENSRSGNCAKGPSMQAVKVWFIQTVRYV